MDGIPEQRAGVETEDAELVLGGPSKIEAEDLAGFLVRLSQQPGRKAVDLVLMGTVATKPDGSTYLVMGVSRWLWWN